MTKDIYIFILSVTFTINTSFSQNIVNEVKLNSLLTQGYEPTNGSTPIANETGIFLTKNNDLYLVGYDGKIKKTFNNISLASPFDFHGEEYAYIIDNTNNLKGILKSDGNIIVPCLFTKIRDYNLENNIALAQKGNDIGIYNMDIWTPIPNLNNYKDGGLCGSYIHIMDKKSFKYGLLDLKGNMALQCDYDRIKKIGNLIILNKAQKISAINEKGEDVTLPPIYEQIDDLYDIGENLIRIELNDKYGIIDVNSNIIVEPQYEYIEDFENGLCFIKYKEGEKNLKVMLIIKARYF